MSTPTVTEGGDESAVAVQLKTFVEEESAHDQPLTDGADAKVSPVGTVATSLGWWYRVPVTDGDSVSVYEVPTSALAGVPELVSEKTGTAVTVTVGAAVAGTAKSGASVNDAVVVYGPDGAVAAMSTVATTVERPDRVVAVQVRVFDPFDRAHVQVDGEGVAAKLSPAGSEATRCAWWEAVPDTVGVSVSV
jgi:hypothetical protein